MRKKWGIIIIIATLAVGFWLWKNQSLFFSPVKISDTAIPAIKKYEGNSLLFNYPLDWHPNPVDLEAELEAINLGIPNLNTEQKLEFLETPLNELDFSDLDTQEYKTFNEREWMIGTRKDLNGITYLFYTNFPVEVGDDPRQSFGLHVTIDKEDRKLEKQLQDLIASLQFK